MKMILFYSEEKLTKKTMKKKLSDAMSTYKLNITKIKQSFLQMNKKITIAF
jgi:hypothetical protein